MKWYISSRTKNKELVKDIIKKLKDNNLDVVFDWTILGELKPFSENELECRKVAKEIATSLRSVDVFVLLSDVAGTDMFVELGIAIAQQTEKNKPRIYIVGENNKRSLMHLHPGIIHLESMNEVFSKEKL